jgi:DNA polymerase III delta prime subunit
MSVFDKLWCEKYRPLTLDAILLDDSIREKVREYATAGEIPNLLFCGPPGQGKTTLAKIIVNDMLDCQYIYINASDENGIDVIRSKVSNFAQTSSIDGKLKVIILDEADYITSQGQAALRNTMETFSSNCRFILTANIKHKIVPAIQSRCTSLDIVPPLKPAARMCFDILKRENVVIEDDDKSKIIALVRKTYPDLRKTINELQKAVVDGKIDINVKGISNAFCKKIIDKLADGDALDIRKFTLQNEAEFNGDYPQLMRELLNAVFEDGLPDATKQQWCLIIADHLYKSVMVVDQEINWFSCALQMAKS